MNSRPPLRRALVTGAAQGIGAAIASQLAEHGHEVVAVDRDAERLAQTCASLSPGRDRIVPLVADLADPAAIEELWIGAESFGPVDILVNNAAITHLKSLWDITLDEWDDVMAVNQRAVFWLSRLAGRAMTDRGWGRIVNVASLAGQAARPSGAHYAATKGAVIALTRVFAAELAAAGVTVNAVSPGTIESPMTDRLQPERLSALRDQIPVGRLGQGTDIASAVEFLVSDHAGFITGATLDLNGGVLMR
jgi:3-oxoacyl-[acyl-carrier protein] reductase